MNKIIFTDELKQQIKNWYSQQNIGLENISQRTNISRKVIKNMLIKEGISIKSTSLICRKYDINEDFLDIIGREQAYFLGWIASDGSVGKNNEVALFLQDRDIDIIKKIKLMTNFGGPIRINKKKQELKFSPKDLAKNFITRRDAYGISIANQKIANKLRELGFDNKKTYTLSFPSFLNTDLMPYFLRGFMEGDGCIVRQEKVNNIYVGMVSTIKFTSECKEFIEKKLSITVLQTIQRSINDYYYSCCRISGNYQALVFLNYVYKDAPASIRMNRKYGYYKSFVEFLLKNPRLQNKTKEQLKIAQHIIQENG